MIVLLSAVLVAFAGFAFLLAEHLRVTSLRRNQIKAFYLAQAGIMQALYDVRADTDGPGGPDGNAIKLGTVPVPSDAGAPGPADDDVFILGGTQADFLLAAMISGSLRTAPAGGVCGNKPRDLLENWTLRNVADGTPISINKIAVSWEPVDSKDGLIRLDVNELTAWTASNCAAVASGAQIVILQPPILASAPPWSVNRLWFSTNRKMDNKLWIEIAFFMADDSVRRVRFRPSAPLRSSASFTIKSLGEVRRGAFPFMMWRRVQAEYRLNDADAVVGLQEPGRITSDAALLLPPAAPAAEQRPGYKELSVREP